MGWLMANYNERLCIKTRHMPIWVLIKVFEDAEKASIRHQYKIKTSTSTSFYPWWYLWFFRIYNPILDTRVSVCLFVHRTEGVRSTPEVRDGVSIAYSAVPKSLSCRPHLNGGGAEYSRSEGWSFPCLFCGTQVMRVVSPLEPGCLGASVERPILHIFDGGDTVLRNVQRIVRVPPDFVQKGLVTSRDYGFFWVKTMLLKKRKKFTKLLFCVILKNSQSDFQIFNSSECKYDVTSLFASQQITVVALSTAPVYRPRAPSPGTPTLCALALHPPSPHQLPLAYQTGNSREPGHGQPCQVPGLTLHL